MLWVYHEVYEGNELRYTVVDTKWIPDPVCDQCGCLKNIDGVCTDNYHNITPNSIICTEMRSATQGA